MSAKTDTQVVIGGRMYTVSGYESEAYLQQVATYLNNKIVEFQRLDGYNRQSTDLQHFLLQLNIADDYFKAKKQISLMEEQIEEKEKALYDIKHELITTQMKLEQAEQSNQDLTQKLSDQDKKIIQLEAEKRSQIIIETGETGGRSLSFFLYPGVGQNHVRSPVNGRVNSFKRCPGTFVLRSDVKNRHNLENLTGDVCNYYSKTESENRSC